MREAATTPCKLAFDLLTLKVVSESRVTWPTSVPILVFLGLSVLEFGPMYATDRRTSDAHHRLMPPTLGAGHNNFVCFRGKAIDDVLHDSCRSKQLHGC